MRPTRAELPGLLIGIAAVMLVAGLIIGWTGVFLGLPAGLFGAAVVMWIKRYWR